MRTDSLLVLASAALALARPVRNDNHDQYNYNRGDNHDHRGSGKDCRSPSVTPTLPLTGGATELPSPPSNLTLKHIAIGLGIQNYTCSAAGATGAAIGALAMLYDITDLYPGGRSSLTQTEWTDLTANNLKAKAKSIPLNFAYGSTGADSENPWTAPTPIKLEGVQSPVAFLGHHYFNSTGTPTFDLLAANQLLVAKKEATAAAPSSAYAGPDSTGAVAWLFLDNAGGSHGVTAVYRVLTAGGNPHTCSGAGVDSDVYSAQYWFYGP